MNWEKLKIIKNLLLRNYVFGKFASSHSLSKKKHHTSIQLFTSSYHRINSYKCAQFVFTLHHYNTHLSLCITVQQVRCTSIILLSLLRWVKGCSKSGTKQKNVPRISQNDNLWGLNSLVYFFQLLLCCDVDFFITFVLIFLWSSESIGKWASRWWRVYGVTCIMFYMRTSCVSVDDRVKHERPCARRALSAAYADDEHQRCRHAGEMKKVDPLFSVFSAVNHFHADGTDVLRAHCHMRDSQRYSHAIFYLWNNASLSEISWNIFSFMFSNEWRNIASYIARIVYDDLRIIRLSKRMINTLGCHSAPRLSIFDDANNILYIQIYIWMFISILGQSWKPCPEANMQLSTPKIIL